MCSVFMGRTNIDRNEASGLGAQYLGNTAAFRHAQ